ncbi:MULTISPECIES: hypothetical protein [unclassified Paenibacillus]|uniref:hypothetical protein n=1 Tax=unclassified Paenibacillus TaxID=185978 RepID=UPI001AEA40DC|nr:MULTISPECIES: hypothetical protein [unclassified Paenibacillus]MBP1157581.1 hypothetical protein [Paenibacillus sp. PvP091]MBP1171682.1 hypothetical protein [Paenibacillus sp. PvR098]MBP2438063.1 hypothetical protein [Paenibacillus sp. PvP052]
MATFWDLELGLTSSFFCRVLQLSRALHKANTADIARRIRFKYIWLKVDSGGML